jgi:hypothetical protein
MLLCYVLTFGRSVTAFSAPPRSQRPGKMPRSPHPKAGPASGYASLQVLAAVKLETPLFCYIALQ